MPARGSSSWRHCATRTVPAGPLRTSALLATATEHPGDQNADGDLERPHERERRRGRWKRGHGISSVVVSRSSIAPEHQPGIRADADSAEVVDHVLLRAVVV